MTLNQTRFSTRTISRFVVSFINILHYFRPQILAACQLLFTSNIPSWVETPNYFWFILEQSPNLFLLPWNMSTRIRSIEMLLVGRKIHTDFSVTTSSNMLLDTVKHRKSMSSSMFISDLVHIRHFVHIYPEETALYLSHTPKKAKKRMNLLQSWIEVCWHLQAILLILSIWS